MNVLMRDIINLVKSALNGESVKLSEEFDWEKAVALGRTHGILPMLYYGATNSGIQMPVKIEVFLKSILFQCVTVDNRQMHEIGVVKKVFAEHNIDFLPLKGCNLKALYPKSEMRMMADADILIKTSQYEDIKKIMSQLGFTEGVESNHEFVWDKPKLLTLELHKMLIPSYNKDYYEYFGDGWRLATKKVSDCEYAMKKEDEFIYLFTHFAKHYRDGGIGIRHICDIYIYLKTLEKADESYLKNELSKLCLCEFYENIKTTVDVWFGGKENTPMTDFITEFIFKSGSFGRVEAHIASEGVKASKSAGKADKVKLKKLWRLIFPPCDSMRAKYPVLKKMPALLPFMWVARWVEAIFLDRGKIKRQNERLKQMSAENIKDYQSALNFVGLDFNFKE